MVVIEIGYQKYCLPKEQAFTMIEILEKAQVYEAKYWNPEKRKERGIDVEYTYHVYPNEKQYSMQLISDDLYNMAKLAGKPERD